MPDITLTTLQSLKQKGEKITMPSRWMCRRCLS